MSVIFYTSEIVKQHTRWRWGEEKFGEKVGTVESWEQLKESAANYVLIGIPEDIGVRANLGKPGTSKAWKAGLTAMCNIQNNSFTNAENVVVLGEIDCSKEMQDAKDLTADDPFYPTKIGSLVKSIDDKVSETIQQIIALNKTPIVIGGGHNNSFGNLKGASLAFHKPINCVNLDAHTDFRALEHRHSGNGFSYAKEEGFLSNYFMLGLHKNYTSRAIFDQLKEHKSSVKYNLFEDIGMASHENLDLAFAEAKKHVTMDPFGIELDMDAIANMGSSAMTPSGFTLEQARKFMTQFSTHKNCAYIHICEGSPQAELFENQVGKAIAYLVSDILR